MTAEEEILAVFNWAQRTGHLNVAAALRRALDKWPTVTTRPDTVPAIIKGGRRTQVAVNKVIATVTPGRDSKCGN